MKFCIKCSRGLGEFDVVHFTPMWTEEKENLFKKKKEDETQNDKEDEGGSN